MTNTVLVIGATGKTGRRLVPLLAATDGVEARAASRHPGSTGVLFDWHKQETHGPALAGADAAYVVLPELVADPSSLTGPFFQEARSAGVRRVVLLAALGWDDAGQGRVIRQLQASDLEWTILRAAAFDQNLSEGFLLGPILERGVIATPAGDGEAAMVDVDDIAAVAAVALTQDGHVGAEYALTGPEPIGYQQAAETIGAVAGREVTHVHIPREALLDILVSHGVPGDYAELILRSFDAIREDEARAVTDDVQRVTGRPATTFAAFAQAAVDAWK